MYRGGEAASLVLGRDEKHYPNWMRILSCVCVRAQMSCHHWHTSLWYWTCVTFLTRGMSSVLLSLFLRFFRCVCYFNWYHTNNDSHNYMFRGCQWGWAGFCCLTREPPKTASQRRRSLNCITTIVYKYSFEIIELKSSTNETFQSCLWQQSKFKHLSLPVRCFISALRLLHSQQAFSPQCFLSSPV